ncbi:type II secretion system protein [Candidatus Uhrbacteria bacterium]|nr:type II secretion system protein [Candidatus Uhrbacteria bacterium]
MTVKRGFTLIEILLVVAAIAILAGIVIVAINPAKQLGDTRNAQRRSDVRALLDAVHQYAIDNNGDIPIAIVQTNDCAGISTNEICKYLTSGSCSGLVELFVLTDDKKYLTAQPIDPSGSTTSGSGYFITKDAKNRITVCAPRAEQGATISVTR